MNEHKVRQMQEAQAQNRFRQALSAGQANVVDRFGAKIEPGMKILMKSPFDLVFEVVSVAPVFDPGAQAGLMSITVSAVFPMQMMANQIQAHIIVLPQLTTVKRPVMEPDTLANSERTHLVETEGVNTNAQGDGDHGVDETDPEAEPEVSA